MYIMIDGKAIESKIKKLKKNYRQKDDSFVKKHTNIDARIYIIFCKMQKQKKKKLGYICLLLNHENVNI